ncbi:MAG: RidA family protein [Anaerolineaceae bacterium]|nr:MAG: RidA family protein [Anaerolineaceae bacterium]
MAEKQIEIVSTKKAPVAIGPYSQAVIANGLIFVAGQIGMIPGNRKMITGDVPAQTRQALENLKAILEAAGSGMAHVVKVTIFMKDLDHFQQVNEVYAEYFSDYQPARSTVQVSRLPATADVEIEAIAVQP